MKSILFEVKEQVALCLENYNQNLNVDASKIELSFPANSEHGDLSLNLALKYSKLLKKAPYIIAQEIIEILKENSYIKEKVREFKVAGPGFINLFYSDSMYNEIVTRVLKLKEEYGKNESLKDRSFLLEFVSANPTGPLTIAHARQAVVGDTLSRLMSFCSARPSKEYYLNDKGVQINTLGESVFRRYLEINKKAEKEDFPDNCYQGCYIYDIAQEMCSKYQDSLKDKDINEGASILKDESYQIILKGIKEDLKDFRVEFDSYFSEKSLADNGKIKQTIKYLKSKGYTYEKEGALWFKTEQFGDDKDRVLIKSNGEYTYLTSDIPYHLDKLERGYDKLINILGPDHHGYIARLKAAVESLGYNPEQLDVLIVQLSSLYRGDIQLKMSTRQGEFISLRELLDEVGIDAARYFFASKKTDSHLDFDLELAKKHTPDNPVFYVQYASARINSIFNKAIDKNEKFKDLGSIFDISGLTGAERKLIKAILNFSEVITDAATSLEPQRLTTYLEDIASIFQSYYSGGNKIITEDEEITMKKLIVCKAFQQVIKNGLKLVGITIPDRM